MAALSHILFLSNVQTEVIASSSSASTSSASTNQSATTAPSKRFIHLTETGDEISLILDATTLKSFQLLCDFNTPLKVRERKC